MKHFAFLSMLAVGAAAQATVLIDDFSQSSHTTGYVTSGYNYDTALAGNVPGGVRLIGNYVFTNPDEEDARSIVNSSAGYFAQSSGPGMTTRGFIAYGCALNTPVVSSNPLNMNLNTDKVISVDLLSTDQNLAMNVRLWTNDFNPIDVAGSAVASASPQEVTFDFSSYDLSDVDTIEVWFDNLAGGDYVVGGVSAVPEPASMALLALGFGAIARRRRK